MNQEIKARWVAALRDGRPQTWNVLERIKPWEEIPAGQCCLGVLCSIAAEDGIVERIESDRIAAYEGSDGVVEINTLPHAVVRWADLPDASPTLPVSQQVLASLNDNGATFAEIADLIEKEF